MRHLGKLPRRRDDRIPTLARYKRALALPTPLSTIDWSSRIKSWPMDLNDSLGDCVIAGMAHAIQLWTTWAQAQPDILTDDQVRGLYEKIGGYDPAKPDTDQGCVMADALGHWLTQGADGHKIAAYASVNQEDLDEVKDAIQWFGCVYIGLQLPISCQSQAVWDVPVGGPNGDAARGSWGGHCVTVGAYDGSSFSAISWGQIIKMTPAFFRAYCDEAYAVQSPDWIETTAETPSGLDLAQMQADMDALKAPG